MPATSSYVPAPAPQRELGAQSRMTTARLDAFEHEHLRESIEVCVAMRDSEPAMFGSRDRATVTQSTQGIPGNRAAEEARTLDLLHGKRDC
jgi:hypothetical protein